MTREEKLYQDNLRQILAFTGGRPMLNMRDLKGFTGLRDARTIKGRYPVERGRISAATFAHCLCARPR